MTALLTLNAFLLFIIAVKLERAAVQQFTLDDDDINYNDWEFNR